MERKQTAEASRSANGRIALVALLVIQILLGYEWLSSGLTKLVQGDFPGGLGHELLEKSEASSGWYRSFLDGTVIPHAHAFGYLIEVGELVTGLALIVAALVWLAAWERLGGDGRRAAPAATAAAAVAGVVMNVNFHLANGSPLPWPIAADSFDEAVDLDSLMAALELVLVGVSLAALVSLRRADGRPHQRTGPRQSPRSRKEMIRVSTHVHSKLSARRRSALWLLAPLIVGLAIGAALFAGRGGTAAASPSASQEIAALQGKVASLQQDARFWQQLVSIFKPAGPAPFNLRSMSDHRLYMQPSGYILALHFDNMNLAKAKNLNWIALGVPGVFTKADQARVTMEFGPGFTHFHDLVHDTHGGKPGAKGAWFLHIGVRDFTSPWGKVTAGQIDPRFMPTPPTR